MCGDVFRRFVFFATVANVVVVVLVVVMVVVAADVLYGFVPI